MSVRWLAVALLFTAGSLVDAQNFSVPQEAMDHLIQTSYSWANNSNASVDCSSFSPAECNMTYACWYNTSVNATSQQCLSRGKLFYNESVDLSETRPWCAEYFPTPFIAAVYLLGAFVAGFALAGAIYNAMWYDTYSRVNEVGERQFNQFYYSTTPINLYCITVVVSTVMMAILSFVNLFDDTICTYVYFVYLFLIIVLGPALVLPGMKIGREIQKRCRGERGTKFVVDDFCMPPTQPAIQDPFTNQVRSF